MTSAAPPEWAVGDDAELVRFSLEWWTRALAAAPLTGSIAERRRIRPAIAAAIALDPGPALLAALDALLSAVNTPSAELPELTGLGLSSREWTEVTAASYRCESYQHALHLTCVAGLDTAKLTENPARATAKDTRRPASDELAAALRIAAGTATTLVGHARQLTDLPAAEDALLRGVMSPPQFRELATICRRLPPGAAGADARAQVEAVAVKAAATLSRARMAAVLEEAALAADPGYQARAMSQGIEARDVQLRRSPKPGCQRVVADLESADAARVWQVINQIAANAKDGDTYATADAGGEVDDAAEEETRTKAQMRADVFVSLVTGDFSPTPELIAFALGEPAPVDTTTSTDSADDDEDDDTDEAAPQQAPVTGLVPDTRKPVHIPTPEQRAHLSEIHVVVFADDLADDEDPDDPQDPQDPGPHGDGPGADDPSVPPHPPSDAADTHHPSDHSGQTPGPAASPPTAQRERPRPTTPHPSTRHEDQPDQPPAHPSVPSPRSESAAGPQRPAPNPPGPARPAGQTGSARLRAARRARATRRALAGYGPFGHVPGHGRLSPETTRATLRAARWRRLVADPTTGVLLHRSRWTLPAPDHEPRTASPDSTRSTAEHLELLLAQHAAPDPRDPATRTEVTYRPSVLLAQHVRTRDAVCISPVCHHPARAGATQLDHTTAYGPHTPTRLRGGLTEAGNLGCICQRWHNAKTHGEWDLVQPTPGTFTWTSPTGLVYHRAATPLLPDLTDLLS